MSYQLLIFGMCLCRPTWQKHALKTNGLTWLINCVLFRHWFIGYPSIATTPCNTYTIREHQLPPCSWGLNDHVSHRNSLLTLKTMRSIHHSRYNQRTYFARNCTFKYLLKELATSFNTTVAIVIHPKNINMKPPRIWDEIVAIVELNQHLKLNIARDI